MSEFDYLFRPFQLGHVMLKNRIVSTAHAPALSENGVPGEREQLYFAEKAKGGAGLVMFGGSTSVHPRSPATQWAMIANRDDSIIPHYRQLADAIHAHGAKTLTQITHLGPRSNSDTEDWLPLWAPSQIPEPIHRELPHAMDAGEIREVVEAFASAARRAQQSGLDGVEVYAAGGHLLGCFMSPLTNQRTDVYGGSLENRLRFTLEVLAAIRAAVGREFVVGVRTMGDELLKGGLDHAAMQEINRQIAATGLIDYISVLGTTPVTWELLATLMPNMYYPQGTHAHLAAGIKQAVGPDMPVLYAGRVVDPAHAERLLAEGQFDLVAMTRALFADPYLPAKVREGRLDDVRPCVGANVCVGRPGKAKAVICVHNPAISREKELAEIVPAATRKRVVVVGGGPAGLEAARVAAIRGHAVVLFEKEAGFGGQVRIAARAPHRASWGEITGWLERQCRKLGVDLRPGVTATVETVLAERPEAVVVATGSTPYRPEIPGAGYGNVTDERDVLLGKANLGQRVAIFDESHDQDGLSTAEYLVDQGKQVQIISRGLYVGDDIEMSTLAPLYARVLGKGVIMTPNLQLRAIEEDALVLENSWSHQVSRLEDIDSVVLATGSRSDDSLYHALKDAVGECYLVGDAMAPRRLPNAMLEGTRVGRQI